MKPLLQVLKKEQAERLPFWFMRQAGRYLPEYRAVREKCGDFMQLCFTPELAAEVTLQPVKRFGMSAAIMFSDILVIPHGLGQRVSFVEGEGPKLEAITQASQIGQLQLGGMVSQLAPTYEAIEMVKAELPAEVALIGFAGAPWTLACYMIEGGGGDFDAPVKFAKEREAEFGVLIALLVDAIVEHLAQQVARGADAVQLFDSWGGMLAGQDFRRWVIEPSRQIVEKFRARCPGVPVIGFPRKAGDLYVEFAEVTGVDAVSIDAEYSLEYARKELQPYCAVQGNLDSLLLATDRDGALARTKVIVDELGGGPFIFNLGHGVLPQTPVVHVEALCELLKTLPPPRMPVAA